ncbi:unnamed protein product [Kluyveromyces dobzhanskii CBS 2104]|uniref:prephenate dehydratase n=1 Tax=Kluyveromyces dobzhanskii CBS 2104 TaxID=1427455 RepID=A0A0A8L825_9SACH|nr:unnamed protein product [Kluyveromyces dobzhanskii CBS 2104]
MSKVLFLGPVGTYSHQAVIQQFPDEELIPAASIPECFERLVSSTEMDYAVVPLENSTNGQVVFTYDLFRDFMELDQNPRLEVVGEQYVDIAHCLISPVKLSVDQLKNVDVVYSHPQVWGQVKDYLTSFDKKYGKTSKIDCSSTSGAVERCLNEYEASGKITLAIGSRVSASLHKGTIVDSDINDIKGNTTRFLVLKRRDGFNKIASQSLPPNGDETKVNFVTFVINQDNPGSLISVLNVLREQDLNMCSISSRPFHNHTQSERKWQYCFFIEFYDKSDIDYELLIESFDQHCERWIHWGRFYRNALYYQIS